MNCRTISGNEWRRIQNKKVKKHKKSDSAKQVKYFRTFWKSIEKSHSSQDSENGKSIRVDRYNKLYKSVAQDAADVGYRKQFKTSIEDEQNKFHFVKSLFQESPGQNFEINKISEYYSDKYKTSVSDWKVSGSV